MAFTLSVEVNTVYALENDIGNIAAEDGSDLTLEGASSITNLTANVPHRSIAMKFNTLDFELRDPPLGSYEVGATVTTTDPSWSGVIIAAESDEPDEDVTRLVVKVTATNTRAVPTDTAPFDLSDQPTDAKLDARAVGSLLLLEDGSSFLLLEDGTDFASPSGELLLEATLANPYAGLKVKAQADANSAYTTIGKVRVRPSFPGLRVGNIFRLTSRVQDYSGAQFRITQAGITFPERISHPEYELEFGDVPQTLADWTQITAPTPPGAVSDPTVVPIGKTIYGKTSAGHKLWPQGGGIVTIAVSAAFTVSAPIGGSLTVQLVGQIDCRAYAWDNYIATPRRAVRAVISGGIFTGAWQETPAGTPTSAGARAKYDLSSAPGISLPAGTYTVSIQIDTQEFNQMEVFSAFAQAAVTAA